MIQLSTLAIIFVISIALGIFFYFKWKNLNDANSAYIDKSRSLISPDGIRAEVEKYGGQIAVTFDRILQSESGFLVHSKVLRFPIHGVNRLVFRHELGHAESILDKRYRWINLASKTMFLRKISIAIGTDYRFEKEAWRRSGYLETGYAKKVLKAYRYVQIAGMFDLLSKIILTVIILRLIF